MGLGFAMNGEALKMTTSIGIAHAYEASVTSEELFATADQALYAAKSADRDTFKVMECNAIEMTRRPSRRRIDVGQQNDIDASSHDFHDSR